MRAYPLLAIASTLAVIAAERYWLKTGVFRMRAYWLAMAICGFFMIWVDGWMSKESAPIVRYNPDHISGIRFPWDIPTEEFLYGWALLTLAILLWERDGQRSPQEPEA